MPTALRSVPRKGSFLAGLCARSCNVYRHRAIQQWKAAFNQAIVIQYDTICEDGPPFMPRERGVFLGACTELQRRAQAGNPLPPWQDFLAMMRAWCDFHENHGRSSIRQVAREIRENMNATANL